MAVVPVGFIAPSEPLKRWANPAALKIIVTIPTTIRDVAL